MQPTRPDIHALKLIVDSSPYQGLLPHANYTSSIKHPSCGDHIVLSCYIKEQQLEKCFFTSEGCLVSQAATALLVAYIQEKSTTFLSTIQYETMTKLLGFSVGPNRRGCIMLVYDALQQIITQTMATKKQD